MADPENEPGLPIRTDAAPAPAAPPAVDDKKTKAVHINAVALAARALIKARLESGREYKDILAAHTLKCLATSTNAISQTQYARDSQVIVSYTVGLDWLYGIPDMVVTGFPPDMAVKFLNRMVFRCLAGEWDPVKLMATPEERVHIPEICASKLAIRDGSVLMNSLENINVRYAQLAEALGAFAAFGGAPGAFSSAQRFVRFVWPPDPREPLVLPSRDKPHALQPDVL
jgi:hypothetical protein